jgi:predicted chitinase
MQERIVLHDEQPKKKIREKMGKKIAAGVVVFSAIGLTAPHIVESLQDHRSSVPSTIHHKEVISNCDKFYPPVKRAVNQTMVENLAAYAEIYSQQCGYEAKATPRNIIAENISSLVTALKEEHIATPRVIAYAMATVGHETWYTFKPIKEYNGERHAKERNYHGGVNYYGRGYIQLTHDYNYKTYGEKIGLGDRLVKNPDLALRSDIAARVLAEFFKGTKVNVKAEKDFVSARAPIHNDDAVAIAKQADEYLKIIS